ncbi:flagella basal body P-ring formation protein FlgA [Candidatus Uabimicrobium amorphum]|uniref:Flagella basal body P-ring formation protein FlgA n=2 Tax=Uabimicrobium amorphum TaxID=2596890 RepID=A0A5S9IP16_UABAM|nr:flagella basal body P-ring formation protein FlgA [Candidatus Uabimicrobium amorphum]
MTYVMSQEIFLQPRAEVKGLVIFLGDIANVNNNKALQKLKIGATPAPGKTRIYQVEEIEDILLRNGVVDFVLHGDEVQVVASRLVISPKELAPLAKEYVHFSLGKTWNDFSIALKHIATRPVILHKPRIGLKISYSKLEIRRRGQQVSVYILLAIDGKVMRKVKVIFSVNIYTKVLVTRRAISAKKKLTPSYVSYKRIKIDNRQKFLTLNEAKKNVRVRHTLPVGHVLLKRDVERVPMIQRNSKIKMLFKMGNLNIEVKVKALEKGFKDDIIRVMNISSRRVLKAKVIGESNVVFISEG